MELENHPRKYCFEMNEMLQQESANLIGVSRMTINLLRKENNPLPLY
jgi:DNA-binding XRE family transcriptional regulator